MHASLSLLDVGLTPALGGEVAGVQAGVRSVQSVRDLLRTLEVLYGVVCACGGGDCMGGRTACSFTLA